jgi:molybdate transport system substrate-binding protein
VRALAAGLAAATALIGCGGTDANALTVFAASSLTDVLRELEPSARYNFAGSDELATQLREGARADVYAAATTRYPEELFAEGLVERPRVFATNRLVLIVPRDNPARIESLADLTTGDARVVVAQEGVPAGDYTRGTLEALRATAVLDRVVSEEEDVRAVVGKVALGEADAGFVYATDARAAADDVRTVELAGPVAASVRYAAAIVRGTGDRDRAERFLERLLGADGRRALRAAGFGLP